MKTCVEQERFGRQLSFGHGATWCSVVYHAGMSANISTVRQSVSLSPQLARRVKAIAKAGRTSASRALVSLIEAGLEAKDRERQEFLALADQLTRATDPQEQARLKATLARLTFGD